MESIMRTFENKLYENGLAVCGEAVLGSLDASLVWNRRQAICALLEAILNSLNINSLIYARPAEPYRTIIDFLALNSADPIQPQDCESRTFLHDIPVVGRFCPDKMIDKLRRRKCVVVPGAGIVTYGTVSLEQAYVTFSSVCFASFVKFFSDYLLLCRQGGAGETYRAAFQKVSALLDPPPVFTGALMKGPFDSEDDICAALEEAGRLTVENRLVDSYFGNISYCDGKTLYISQTGSSLDQLKGCIDPCPLDGSSCAAITASSELTAHLGIISETNCRAILHGHPKFSVILSMDCYENDCAYKGQCHVKCPRKRHILGIPVVSGEVGTGPYGLCHTVPGAIKSRSAVLVYGHGVFTTGRDDFNAPFHQLLDIENVCREEYFRRIRQYE